MELDGIELVRPMKLKKICNDEDGGVIINFFFNFMFCVLNPLSVFKCGLCSITWITCTGTIIHPYV